MIQSAYSINKWTCQKCYTYLTYIFFKPEQLGGFRIKEFVKAVDNKSLPDGVLKEMDSILLLVDTPYSEIEGVPIYFLKCY